MYKFNVTTVKIPAGFLVDIDKVNFKTYMKRQKIQTSQNSFEKNKVEGITLPDFKTYYKVKVIKIVCIDKRINTEINEIEQSLEIDPHKYGQLILDKDAKTIQGERMFLSTNGFGTIGCPYTGR